MRIGKAEVLIDTSDVTIKAVQYDGEVVELEVNFDDYENDAHFFVFVSRERLKQMSDAILKFLSE